MRRISRYPGRGLPDAELLAAGISGDYVHVSVGLEDVGDIIADLDQALAAVGDKSGCFI